MIAATYLCPRCLGHGHAFGDMPMVGVNCLRCVLIDDVTTDVLIVEMEAFA